MLLKLEQSSPKWCETAFYIICWMVLNSKKSVAQFSDVSWTPKNKVFFTIDLSFT